MKRHHIISLLLIATLFTACQNQSNIGQPPQQEKQTEQIQPGEKAIDQSPPSPTRQKTEQEPVLQPTAVQQLKEIPKIYKMNKNYDIIPKDPAANKKVVLLTFDDGPKDKKLLEPMLEVLDKHKAKAIFFVNGYRVKQNPDLLKLIHDRGHSIGNHSWDHINLKNEANDKIERQIRDAQNIVKELTGASPVFFRPPFGSSNEHVKEVVKEEKMLFMNWSNGSEDWVAKYQNPQGLTQRVLEQLHPGSNILMHELPWTVEALDGLLSKLEEHGYSFVDPHAIDTE